MPTCLSARRISTVPRPRETGKPENIIEKIIDGQINKFYADICLLEQQFVKDTDKTIQQLAAETGKALGTTITITRFTKYVLGEGLGKEGIGLCRRGGGSSRPLILSSKPA